MAGVAVVAGDDHRRVEVGGTDEVGNVNMSSVTAKETSEVGGLQGVFQNLGSSLGTALIGSVLIASLGTSFVSAVNASSLPSDAKSMVNEQSSSGIGIVPVASVDAIVEQAGLSASDGTTLTQLYSDSQVSSLRLSFFALTVIALFSLIFSRGIPSGKPKRPVPAKKQKAG